MKKLIYIPFLFLFSFFLFSFTFVNNETSYIVLDKNTNRILEGSNYNTQLLVASTAKILTAITTIENYDLEEEIVITKDDCEAIGSKIYLNEKEKISRRSLLYGLLLRSANDAASALSQNNSDLFIYQMNEIAKKIGMTSSIFSNASGLDEKEYNLSTAYDMALLASYASKNNTFLEIASSHSYNTKSDIREYNFINKHKLVYKNNDFLWGKTGYTKKSKRVLISNFLKDNMDVIIVTINDSSDWFHHQSLAKSLNNYNFKVIINKGVYDTKLDVTYYLYFKNDLIIPLKDEEKIKIEFVLHNDYAYITIYLKDEMILKQKCDIYYKNNFEPDIIIDYLT